MVTFLPNLICLVINFMAPGPPFHSSASWPGNIVLGQAVVATVSRKQQPRVPMSCPVRPEQLQRRRWQRDVTILGALTAMDMHEATLRVDVADLKVEPFVEPEPERIDGPKVHEHSRGSW